jgi:hypothetical protein
MNDFKTGREKEERQSKNEMGGWMVWRRILGIWVWLIGKQRPGAGYLGKTFRAGHDPKGCMPIIIIIIH